MLFGRHQLIKLSPKKTVEGFVGAFFVTVVFAVAVHISSLVSWITEELEKLMSFFIHAVEYDFHALQLHDLPSSRPLDKRILEHPVHAQPRL